MKIVMGGASGLIGKRLVQALRARGDEVVLLLRKPAAAGPWASGCRVVQWDGRAHGDLAAVVDGADAVLNLAGANVGGKRWSDSYKREIRESRIESTRALVAALGGARKRPRTFLSASAVGFYGDRGDEVVDESAAPGSDFLATVCVEWEREAEAAARLPPPVGEPSAAPVRVVLLRTGVVLAPPAEGGALAQMVTPFKLFAGGPVGSGRQWIPWIHIDDEVGAILWALDHETVRGAVNLVAPGAQTMAAFCTELGRALRRPSWAPVPGFMLRLVVGEMAEVLLGWQHVRPALLDSSGFHFRYPNSELALENLLPPRAQKEAAGSA